MKVERSRHLVGIPEGFLVGWPEGADGRDDGCLEG